MTEIERTMDVERVKNLMDSFDWVLIKTESGETKVTLTLEKDFEPVEVEIDKGAS